MRLFINNQEIDLYKSEVISYTKKVNSLRDISKRDSNFTKSFKVPKTAKNIAIFQGLGINGTNSPMPYQKNTARLFVGNNCIIFKGWAMFLGENKDYDICIYDGHIDFMKYLDNITFNDIDLPEISHTKEVPVIKENWENGNEFYKYLLADFNGKTHFINGDITYINADYLVPSVRVKYLWERIFQTFGFTFSGSIFQEEEFNNLYLTYPKGVIAGSEGELAFSLTFPNQYISYASYYNQILFTPRLWEGIVSELLKGEIVDNTSRDVMKHWMCTEEGFYNVKITGSMANNDNHASFFYLGKNLHDVHIYDMNNNDFAIRPENQIADHIAMAHKETSIIDFEQIVQLKKGDTLTPYYYRTRGSYWDHTKLDFKFTVTKVDQTTIDQIEFFKNLTPKDFYKEILWRFGLTPFPAKDSNHIEFLTYEERTNGETLDWSSKFIQKVSTEYGLLDDYAKNNYFRYKYNSEDSDFNDGVIRIMNENLKEKTDIISSKTYSPEKLPVPFDVGGTLEQIPKLGLWEKEPTEKDDVVVIQYNPRDSRFTFVRERVIQTAAPLGSEQLQVYENVTQVRTVENYYYSWQRIVHKWYSPITALFRNSVTITAQFHLSKDEFDNCDLKHPIYIEQLGGSFLINTIKKGNLSKKLTEVELIKINK